MSRSRDGSLWVAAVSPALVFFGLAGPVAVVPEDARAEGLAVLAAVEAGATGSVVPELAAPLAVEPEDERVKEVAVLVWVITNSAGGATVFPFEGVAGVTPRVVGDGTSSTGTLSRGAAGASPCREAVPVGSAGATLLELPTLSATVLFRDVAEAFPCRVATPEGGGGA